VDLALGILAEPSLAALLGGERLPDVLRRGLDLDLAPDRRLGHDLVLQLARRAHDTLL
jgi:hypothetical protein